MNCIICNNEKVSLLKKESREGDILELYKCRHCGHLWQPSLEYEDIYSNGEFSQIARGDNIPSDDKIKQLDQTALSRFFLYKNMFKGMDEILEVGSSIGSFIHLLRIYGKNAYGLEPDNDYCSFSKKQYGIEQYPVMLEDFNAQSKYGGVINFHVIEHVSNPHKFLNEIHGLLDDGGKILIECPSLDIHLSGNMKKFIWKPHIHYFTLSSLYYVISFYFKVIKIGYNRDSLYVYAQKNSDNTGLYFSKIVFNRLKLVSKFVYLFNSIPIIPNICKTGINQIISNSASFSYSNLILNYIMFKKYIRKERKNKNEIPISHVSVYTLGNVGDTVLSKCVRDVFNGSNKNLKWILISVWDSVGYSLIDKINKSKMLLIGGGGLFLPDTNKNSISGWQWACSKQSLNDIKVPIVVFAVGYNYFKGQRPEELFVDNIKELVKKSTFFGLRNSGSRKKLIELVGNEFKDKIVFQPCPTTLIRKLYSIPEKRRTRNIAFNVAYDRYERRFGKDIYRILDQIAIAAKLLSEKKYNIYIVGHVDSDFKFELSLEKRSVTYESISLNGDFPEKVLDFYNNMDVVIGMRGHAQMIPFGLNCGIITLGSHDKMKWFLEDIDALDFYIDMNKDPELLSEKIVDKFESLYEDDFNNTIEKIKAEQERLYEITLNNLSNIKVKSSIE